MENYNLGDGKWRLREADSSDWVPTTLPGEVHISLMDAGLIPDPFIGENEFDVQWVAETDWEFEGVIEVSEQLYNEDLIFLTFDGLDALAQVILNDSVVGEANNAFRTYSWEVKDLLRIGINQLRIVFYSPINYVTSLQNEEPLSSLEHTHQGGQYLRKATYQWGWDWGPKLPPIGIWKAARLEGFSGARFESVHLNQRHHSNGEVSVIIDATIDQWTEISLELHLLLTDPNGQKVYKTFLINDREINDHIEVSDPILWWPNGYGEQALYKIEVILQVDDQHVLDKREYQIGLRTIELQKVKDAYGESFTFNINGVPIFAKGTNWIPADSFSTRITYERLDQLLGYAALAHNNMIRVWGGGFYESEDFYDLCDQYGILVWQDFMFSCSVYPLHRSEFIENIHKEVIDNVSRLRHRASLVLWCGNNEMDMGWEIWDWDRGESDKYLESYKGFFYETLPRWISELDPDTAYWFSSPSSATPFENSNSNEIGDAHYWDVWHGAKPFTAYRDQYPRFMSEFGFQSLPPLKTIRAFADEDHWNLTDYLIEHHQRSNSASALFMGQMALHYRMPSDFPSLVYLTMILQAEGIRYGVEHWRRNMHRVSGSLYWQLNDCWPVASWSSIDYFGRWKALHYLSRRFFKPLLLSIEDEEKDSTIKVHLTSDLLEKWEGEVRWKLLRLDGEVLDCDQTQVSVDPLTSCLLYEGDYSHLDRKVKRETVFVSQLVQQSRVLTTQLAPFVRNKHLQLKDPQLKINLFQINTEMVCIELKAESLARFVEISLTGADVILSDNYFDVLPGETCSVTFNLPAGWKLDDARQSLSVFSLFDSFA